MIAKETWRLSGAALVHRDAPPDGSNIAANSIELTSSDGQTLAVDMSCETELTAITVAQALRFLATYLDGVIHLPMLKPHTRDDYLALKPMEPA